MNSTSIYYNSIQKVMFCILCITLSYGVVKADELLVPSLLIDATLTNTNPGPGDQFCYKIRYRCSSTTDHCTDAYIDMTFPDWVNVSSLPPLGGNIVNITETPGTPSGTYVRLDLESPPTAGFGNGILAAGSSGIFEICLLWDCLPDGDTQGIAVGNTLNFIADPTFYASGISAPANMTPDVFVPAFQSCLAPENIVGGYRKGTPTTEKVNPGGTVPFIAQIPAHNGTVFTDMFDTTNLLLSNIELPDTSWVLEILCDTNWYTIPNVYRDLGDWLSANATAGTLSNLEINGIQTGCSADTAAITASSNGWGYSTDILGIRITTMATTGTTFTDFTFFVKDDVPIGTNISNCFVFDDPAVDEICSSAYNVASEPSLDHTKVARSGIGSTAVPTFPPNLPAKRSDDILWEIRWGAPFTNGNPVSGFILSDTLPIGLTFDTDPIDGNWTSTFIPDNGTVPAPFDMFNQADCNNPTFTSSVLPDGRTLLEWDFGTCTSYSGFGFHSRPQTFVTTRFDRTVPLPSVFQNCVSFGLRDGTEIWCGTGNGPSTEPMCVRCGNSSVPATGGAIYGQKSVNGNLDMSFAFSPNIGDTDTSGIAIYEIQIEIADLEGMEKIEVVDILPHIGDNTLTPIVPRLSEWSAEIAGPLVIDKFDILAQTWVPVTTEITNELYSTTYNPCYLDASLQVKTQINLQEPASVNCGSTDFSSTNPVVSAKAFALTWENTTDPLLFGEILRIQVPIRQLSGEADPINGAVAFNSFGVTSTQPDGDELFSSEPLKVGLQIIEDDFASIGDRIWNDLNANGIQDPNEPPIQGVTVSLVDNAGNPVMAGGLPVQQITDQFGNYQFSGLDPNTPYLVRLDNVTDYNNGGPLTNLILTQANQGSDDNVDSDAGLFGNFPAAFLSTGAAGTLDDSIDFGFYQGATICGLAWKDDNGDGIQDVIENPMDSVQLQLINQFGAVIATTTTDALGKYNFTNVTPGTYTIQVTNLGFGNCILTLPNATADDNFDSDADIFSIIGPIILESGDFSCNHDVGYRLPIVDDVLIMGTVWDELINDGIQDANELGVQGIQVNLLDASQFVIASTFTDANGDYLFDNLPPNQDYFINVVPGINNPITSPQNAGTDDTVDSDIDVITGTTTAISTLPNDVITNIDAGIIFPYSLGNLVWIDSNENGLYEVGESVVPNAEIYLFDETIGIYLDTTITDMNGKFVFKNLQPGDYSLELLLPTDLRSTEDIVSSPTPNSLDGDDNGTGVFNATHVKSSVITIVPGGGFPWQANWTELDHGQPINGAFDIRSTAKAYYTLDFGLNIKMDCSIPLVEYAITNGAISKAGQTTDYFYPGPFQNLQTTSNHDRLVQQDGVIRCFDYCTFGTWDYYFNPLDPEEFLFAIENGTNVTPIEYIELRVDDIPSDRYFVTTNDATIVMARDWFVRTTNDAPLLDATGNPTTVNIRFYFPEEEFKEIVDEAIAVATGWGGYLPSVSDVYWFKKDTFDPDRDIDPTGSLLQPNNINSLRNATTSSIGANTMDGVIGQTGNGKNHIQFNGITEFSGGTAAVTINRFALPVELTKFEAKISECDVILDWSVASETNFSHYIIEKSEDGVSFEYEGKILSQQSEGTKSYSHTDENINGKMFYRLKMIDLDGTYEFSKVVVITTDCEEEISNLNLYPNPIGLEEASLNISFLNRSESEVNIMISDVLGTDMMTFNANSQIGNNLIHLDISTLATGTYFVTIKKATGKALSQRFVKIKE